MNAKKANNFAKSAPNTLTLVPKVMADPETENNELFSYFLYLLLCVFIAFVFLDALAQFLSYALFSPLIKILLI